MAVFVNDRHRVVVCVWLGAREHLEEHDSQAVEVTACVDRLAVPLGLI